MAQLYLFQKLSLRAKRGLILVFLLFTTPSYACDLKQLGFGKSINEVAEDYRLSTIGATVYGETRLVARGSAICKEFPTDSTVEFLFLYNKLVEVQIEREESEDSLLNVVKAELPQAEPKEDAPSTALIFDEDNLLQSVVYKTLPYGDGKKKESLTLRSKRHDNLFARIAKSEKDNITKD